MTDLLTFEKLLTAIGAIIFVALVPSIIKWALLRLMRQTMEDQSRMLEHRDKELVDFRRIREEDVARIKNLTDKEAGVEERLLRQAAILYSQEVYIRKLERLCIAAGKALPKRDRAMEELDQ